MQSPTRKPQQEVLHSHQTPETFSTRLSNKLSGLLSGYSEDLNQVISGDAIRACEGRNSVGMIPSGNSNMEIQIQPSKLKV